MQNKIKTIKYPNGEIQRIQIVTLDDWNLLSFFKPKMNNKSIDHLANLYQNFFIKRFPLIFGTYYIFYLPGNYEMPIEFNGDKGIELADYLERNLRCNKAQNIINDLKEKGYLKIVKGLNPFINKVMYFNDLGFLSDENTKLSVNANFFSFDLIDKDSKYDTYGVPIGLCLEEGKILNPPLFNRHCLFVDKDNNVSIKRITLNDINISIKGTIYERPQYKVTPSTNNKDVVIIGNKVVAINEKGRTTIPLTGYVIDTNEDVKVGDLVKYSGLEDYIFAIQCGNPAIIDNQKVNDFIDDYYNLKKIGSIKTLPSNYPLDYKKARAPRIVIGNNEFNKPVIIWFEGKPKCNYHLGLDSCGASLQEVADILEDLEIKNAINLDGGGSAQIILEGKRYLKISDRDMFTEEERERPIPLGLIIK